MTVLPAKPKGRPAEDLARACVSLRALGIRDRKMYSLLFQKTLEENPNFFGVWTVWEPNALDGQDEEYRSAPGHDKTGRFLPFWQRRHGHLQLDVATGYEKPGPGDWYWVPTQKRRLCVMDPYLYPVGGSRCLIASQVAPIIDEGVCLGATGVDFSVEWMAASIRRTRRRSAETNEFEDILERGIVFLDNSGRVTHWSRRTQEIIGRYFPQPERSLRREVNEVLAKSGHHEPRNLTFRNGGTELCMTMLRLRNEVLVTVAEIEPTALDRAGTLTAREREVYHWLCQGKSNEQIADILGISVHTVKNHLDHIFGKLGVDNRVAAAMACIDQPLAA